MTNGAKKAGPTIAKTVSSVLRYNTNHQAITLRFLIIWGLLQRTRTHFGAQLLIILRCAKGDKFHFQSESFVVLFEHCGKRCLKYIWFTFQFTSVLGKSSHLAGPLSLLCQFFVFSFDCRCFLYCSQFLLQGREQAPQKEPRQVTDWTSALSMTRPGASLIVKDILAISEVCKPPPCPLTLPHSRCSIHLHHSICAAKIYLAAQCSGLLLSAISSLQDCL